MTDQEKEVLAGVAEGEALFKMINKSKGKQLLEDLMKVERVRYTETAVLCFRRAQNHDAESIQRSEEKVREALSEGIYCEAKLIKYIEDLEALDNMLESAGK